jgi:hypothetical protein
VIEGRTARLEVDHARVADGRQVLARTTVETLTRSRT